MTRVHILAAFAALGYLMFIGFFALLLSDDAVRQGIDDAPILLLVGVIIVAHTCMCVLTYRLLATFDPPESGNIGHIWEAGLWPVILPALLAVTLEERSLGCPMPRAVAVRGAQKEKKP